MGLHSARSRVLAIGSDEGKDLVAKVAQLDLRSKAVIESGHAKHVLVQDFIPGHNLKEIVQAGRADSILGYGGTVPPGSEAKATAAEAQRHLCDLGVAIALDVVISHGTQTNFWDAATVGELDHFVFSKGKGKVAWVGGASVPINAGLHQKYQRISTWPSASVDEEEDYGFKDENDKPAAADDDEEEEVFTGFGGLLNMFGTSVPRKQTPSKANGKKPEQKKNQVPAEPPRDTTSINYTEKVNNLVDRLLAQNTTEGTLFGAQAKSRTVLPEFEAFRSRVQRISGKDMGEAGILTIQDGFINVIEKKIKVNVNATTLEQWKNILHTPYGEVRYQPWSFLTSTCVIARDRVKIHAHCVSQYTTVILTAFICHCCNPFCCLVRNPPRCPPHRRRLGPSDPPTLAQQIAPLADTVCRCRHAHLRIE